MPAILAALASGLLFGLGLTVSQMINPAKVIAFLDILGDWDPSLSTRAISSKAICGSARKASTVMMVTMLGLAGCGCLVLMLLTHVAERLHVLPGMGWGMPNSPGHYLDLVSAILGFVYSRRPASCATA